LLTAALERSFLDKVLRSEPAPLLDSAEKMPYG
jgi:hypothetical protein